MWKEEIKTALKSTAELNHYFKSEFPETNFPVFVPQALAAKIASAGMDSPLAKQFLPQTIENHELQNTGMNDPIGDQKYLVAPQLIHRYQNRALFLPVIACPVHCRYCFRRNEIAEDETIFKNNFQATLTYLKEHTEINEIIFTGGDPLMLSNEKIDFYLESFAQIPHIKFIRFHSRFPIIVPSRIDADFLNVLNKYTSVFTRINFGLHVNHADEIGPEVMTALQLLGQIPIGRLTQTVLLKDINAEAETLIALFEKIVQAGFTPYYLHHPDAVKGGMHFTLSLPEGRRLYAQLRSKLPGWCVPQYVIDIPGGEGKVSAFNPENYEYSGQLINQKNETILISL
ncbi:MAG: KamA family radical SAM protein [Bacteriovoracaceae bacterium]|nr:KamA family radical SAM protein [Bacteriovoracaceae bacterium]